MGFGSGDLGMGVTFTLRNNASRPASQAGRSMTNLERVTQKASVGINMAVGSITSGLIGLTIVAAALLGPFVAATSAAAAFEKQMSEVAAKAQIEKLSDDYARLSEQSLLLGEATKFTAIQVAEGQTFLAQTGLETNQILSAMPGLLDLASAGNLDLARSADIASNILIAMGLEATEMARVADVLAVASVKANVSVEQLGESFKFAAPFANQLGISLEQTAALVGMLGDMGVQGTLAGTSIKNFAARTAALTPEKLKEFNLVMSDISDNAGNLLELDVVFKNVIDKLKGLGDLERVNALTDLFGLRGNVALASAMSESAKDLKTFTLDLENSTGEAKKIAAKMLDNLAGDIIKFRSVVETTMITAGRGLEKGLRPVVQIATEIVKEFKDLIATPFGQWAVKVSGGVAALTVTLLALGFIVGILIPAMKTLMISLLNPVFLTIAAIVVAIVGSIVLFVKAIREFKKVMEGAEAETGFVGFLQKLGGTVMGLIEIWKTWDGVTFTLSKNMRDSLQKIGILDFVLSVGTWLIRVKEFMKGFMDSVIHAWNVVKTTFGFIRDGINSLIDVLIDLGVVFPKLTSKMDAWREAGRALGAFITGTLIGLVVVLTIKISALAIAVLAATWPIWLTILAFAALIFYWDGLTAALGRFMTAIADFTWDNIISSSPVLLSFMADVIEFFNLFSDKKVGIITDDSALATLKERAENINANVSFGKLSEDNLNTIRNIITDNRASAATPFAHPPQIIDKTTTDVKAITIQNIVDGDVISEQLHEIEQQEDARQ